MLNLYPMQSYLNKIILRQVQLTPQFILVMQNRFQLNKVCIRSILHKIINPLVLIKLKHQLKYISNYIFNLNMGNQEKQCCSALVAQDYPTINFQQLRRRKKTQTNIKQQFESLQIDQAYQGLFVRFYQQFNQQHLFQVIQSMPTTQQRNKFMQVLYDVNIDILDSLFYSTKKLKKNDQGKYKRYFNNSKSSYQRELNSSLQKLQDQVTNITSENQRYAKQCDSKIVDVTEIMTKNQDQYQKIKQVGLTLLKQGKVCFIVLSGGRNFRFGETCKELQKLETPSEKNMIQRILHRYNALGQIINKKLQIFILSNYSKENLLKQQLKNLYFNKLQISFMNQFQMGGFSESGQVVLNQQGMPELFPTGTGQIWDFIKNEQQFEISPTKYKYMYFVGVSNAIQHCFDCYMLGRMQCQGLQWTTKIVDSLGKHQSKIFLNAKNQVQVCDPQEVQFYPANCTKTFTNHSIVSASLIQKALRKQGQQFRHFRKKTDVKKKCNIQRIKVFKNRQNPISSQDKICEQAGNKLCKIIHFQNYYSDIFRLSDNYKLFKYFRYDQYYPFIFKKHIHSDVSHASQAICQLHKKWLSLPNNLSNSKIQINRAKRWEVMNSSYAYHSKQNQSNQNEQLCEIDPYVSLQGQNLQQVKKELCNCVVSFPIFIDSQEKNYEEAFQGD